MSLTTVGLALFFFGFVINASYTRAALGKEAFKVTVNGASCTEDAPYYPIHPGQANHLTIQADFEEIGQEALTATLVRTCPDGRSAEATAKLSSKAPESIFDLGAFAVPAAYDYEHGVVYRRGYRFKLTVSDADGKAFSILDLHQRADPRTYSESLWIGDVGCHVFDISFHNKRRRNKYWRNGGRMDPPFLLQLDRAVLNDPDDVRVQFRQKDGLGLDAVPAELIVTRVRDGETMLEKSVTVGPKLVTEVLDVSQYDEGEYRVELRPIVNETADREGPRLIYRRRVPDPSDVVVSPLAPWTLTRDSTREEVVISDFQDAIGRWGEVPDAEKWDFGKHLLGRGNIWAKPVRLRLGLNGHYAIFASSKDKGTCYICAGKDGVVRRLGGIYTGVSRAGEKFIVATDMTHGEISFFQSGTKGQGLASLLLVPVTAESVAAFEKETSNPPNRLFGYCEWRDFFLPGIEPRRASDQFEALVKAHSELGMRDLQWAAGRGTLFYHSKLCNATRWPAVSLHKLDPKLLKRKYLHFPTWDYMTNQYCALDEVEKCVECYGIRVWPFLAMQRHYGGGYGGAFQSKWFASHTEWRRWQKHATKPDGGEMSYFFPEVRKERVNILCELAERENVGGIVVDCVRQPPMLLYHPEMVAAYKQKTGVDPQTIDGSAGKAYEDWIRWRANFFTETLRELKTRLAPIRRRRGVVIPVAVRIPSSGMLYSMAQGFDVETWCREGLVAVIQLEPLEDRGGRGSHDIRPYIEMGHRHNILVVGGINANTWRNYTAVMKRALGLLDADADGIYFYESNRLCAMHHPRWIIPLLGNRQRLADFLKISNIEACYPVRATNAWAGYDNHSKIGYNWNVYDGEGRPL